MDGDSTATRPKTTHSVANEIHIFLNLNARRNEQPTADPDRRVREKTQQENMKHDDSNKTGCMDAPPTPPIDTHDRNIAARRNFLAFLGGATALLAGSSASAAPTASTATGADVEKKLVSEVWGYAPPAKAKLTPRAAKLTLGDLDALRDGRVTKRTRAVTWKDLTSLVDALGEQYGMNKHPFNPSGSIIAGSQPAAGSCCCCCTCCCGDCTFSFDCTTTLTTED